MQRLLLLLSFEGRGKRVRFADMFATNPGVGSKASAGHVPPATDDSAKSLLVCANIELCQDVP